MNDESHTCRECGEAFVVDDRDEHYMQLYQWGDGGFTYCLACWLGVGPKAE